MYDNNTRFPPPTSEGSRLVKVMADGEIEVIGISPEAAFYTATMGKHQHLDGGGILYSESTKARAIEIDGRGRVVWEYINHVAPGVGGLLEEAQRLPQAFDAVFFERARQACGNGPNA